MAADDKRPKEGTATAILMERRDCNNTTINLNCQNEFEVLRRVHEMEIERRTSEKIERNVWKCENQLRKQERRKNGMIRKEWLQKTWKY